MSFADWIAQQELPAQRKHLAAVQDTSEFRRIRDASWYDWSTDPNIDSFAEQLGRWLKAPRRDGRTARRGNRMPKPVQAAVCRAFVENGGCFAPVRTGGGKTDISLVLAEVAHGRAEAELARGATGQLTDWHERPLLLVPAAVCEKTRRNAAELAEHYHIRALRILSYQALSMAKHAKLLEQWQPTMFILDEAHYVKDSGGARWERIKRYDAWCAKNNRPRAPMLAMSGSFTSRSIKEYQHVIRRCLGAGAPLPTTLDELLVWAFALDEKVPEAARIEPGALLNLAPGSPEDPQLSEFGHLDAKEQVKAHQLALARSRYGRRLTSTRGVVASAGDMPPCGLEITIQKLPPTPPMREAVEHLRSTWSTPCGLPFETAMDLWRHERETSCGLYYRWKHQPPPEWMKARKERSMFIREVLSNSKTLDTPMQVDIAIRERTLPKHHQAAGEAVLAEWERVRDSFYPITEPVWICDSTLQHAAAWLKSERGIVWVHHSAFGRQLEALCGVPYFKEQGRNAAGVAIDMHDGPAIASIQSCGTGFDLQGTKHTKAKHYKNLIVTCPTLNSPNEQLLSRTHREGQEQDTVHATYLQRLEGDERALAQSRADAAMVALTKRAAQRLTVATWLDE